MLLDGYKTHDKGRLTHNYMKSCEGENIHDSKYSHGIFLHIP